MDVVTSLKKRLRESERRNAALQNENESLQSQIESLRTEFASFRNDQEALIDATRAMVGERDLLKDRVAELEVANKRLVDMLWGRRTERRSDSPDQMQLPSRTNRRAPRSKRSSRRKRRPTRRRTRSCCVV